MLRVTAFGSVECMLWTTARFAGGVIDVSAQDADQAAEAAEGEEEPSSSASAGVAPGAKSRRTGPTPPGTPSRAGAQPCAACKPPSPLWSLLL